MTEGQDDMQTQDMPLYDSESQIDDPKEDGNCQLAPYIQIGKGHCGSVWASDRDGPTIALKREDGGPGRSVRKDSEMHQKVEGSLETAQDTLGLAMRVNIPKHYNLVESSNKKWWRQRASRFPDDYKPCLTLRTERILPLPREVRELLIDRFCPEAVKEAVKKNRKDEACLVRPYLGRRTFNCAPSRFFTLRNKPLHINQMEEIELPVETFATEMAEALSVIYWHAKVDANDIEFVLAPARFEEGMSSDPTVKAHRLSLQEEKELMQKELQFRAHRDSELAEAIRRRPEDPTLDLQHGQKVQRFLHDAKTHLRERHSMPSTEMHSSILGYYKLWVLDFDCVKELPQDRSGIDQAARAYMRNDPFWPRPDSDVEADQKLWAIFSQRFLEASGRILGHESMLPLTLIKKIEQLGMERREEAERLREKELAEKEGRAPRLTETDEQS